MAEFYIDGKRAVTEAGQEVEFTVTNPLFTDDEGGTLNMRFPLRGCAENREIFGHLERRDVMKKVKKYGCVMMTGRMNRRGTLLVTDIDEDGVTGQFVDGVLPEEAEPPVDKIKINEMDLGSYPVILSKDISPIDALHGRADAVCMPWIADSGTVVNNYSRSGSKWDDDTERLSWQPMLLPLLRRVAAEVGYTLEISALTGTFWERVMICNSLPGVWLMPEFAAALPAWTVRELLDELGKIMKGLFIIDDSERSIRFDFYDGIRKRAGEIYLEAVDEYTSKVDLDDEDADYLALKRYRYGEQAAAVWKYLDCPGILQGNWDIKRYDTIDNMIKSFGNLEFDQNGHRLPGAGTADIWYAADVDTYFMRRKLVVYSEGRVADKLSEKYDYLHFTDLQPLNVFGPDGWKKGEENDYDEMGCSPVAVDWALEGRMMFLPLGSYQDQENVGSILTDDFDNVKDFGSTIVNKKTGEILTTRMLAYNRTRIDNAVINYDEESGNYSYYDKLYLGVVTGLEGRLWPVVDVDCFRGNFDSRESYFRLSGGVTEGIDPTVKYEIEFLSDRMPEVSGTFVIDGQRYVCRSITATLTDEGLLKLMKGEFYRIS